MSDHLRAAKVLYAMQSPGEARMATRYERKNGYRLAAEDPWDSRLAPDKHFIALLASRLPNVEVRDLTPILDAGRHIKSPAEIALLRRAGALTAQAVIEAMRATRPGMLESHLEAISDYVFRSGGAMGHGYHMIVASGENTWHAHYIDNDCPMVDGDIVLMDGAPDVGYYTSDIGRVWPVNGTYAPWQRELYGFVVEYHKALLRNIRAGVMPDDVLAAARAEMADALAKNDPFSKRLYRRAADRMLAARGALSHPVGMTVHDHGPYRDAPLQPGFVFSVDPILTVPEERVYVRAEDTVLVTADGIENLTGAAPLDLDDVEAMMREESRFPL